MLPENPVPAPPVESARHASPTPPQPTTESRARRSSIAGPAPEPTQPHVFTAVAPVKPEGRRGSNPTTEHEQDAARLQHDALLQQATANARERRGSVDEGIVREHTLSRSTTPSGNKKYSLSRLLHKIKVLTLGEPSAAE